MLLPVNPRFNPNGSFQSPKPQVPGKLADETLASKRIEEYLCGKFAREYFV